MNDAVEQPERIVPFYEMSTPGEDILVIDDVDATIEQQFDKKKVPIEVKGKLKIILQWSPMGLYWELVGDGSEQSAFYLIFNFGEADLIFYSSKTKANKIKVQILDFGSSRVTGFIQGLLELGSDHKIDKITFHLPDYLYFQSGKESKDYDLTASANSILNEIETTDIILEADEWTIILQPYENFNSLKKEADKTQKVVLSGVGQITKSDLSQFKKNEVKPLLSALNVFLSFAFAEWTPPLLAVGSNEVSKKSCQLLRSFNVIHKSYSQGWLDQLHSQDLTEAFPDFYKLWKKKNWREPLKLAVQWLIEATRLSGGAEGAIAFGQIPLEMLASLIFVDDRTIIKSGELDKLSAASRLKLLLAHCGIPFEIPPELKTLSILIKNTSIENGPQLVTEVRNKIIHPTQNNRDVFREWEAKYHVKLYDIFWETHQLLKWYITLVLLNQFGYSGFYANRLSIEYDGSPQRVPWADSDGKERE